MRKYVFLIVAALMAALSASAQRLQVVDKEGRGVALASVLHDNGILIGTTDINGVLADVKGARQVTVTHVAFKPVNVNVADLTDGRVTLQDGDFELQEIVVSPKPFVYVETYYRTYVYRDDSLCYFLAGIMPNAIDTKTGKKEHGSYNQAYGQYCSKMGAAITWWARAEMFEAGQVRKLSEEKIKKEYDFVLQEVGPGRTAMNIDGKTLGYIDRLGGQTRLTVDAAKAQMHANERDGNTKLLERRREAGYEYQYTTVYSGEDGQYDIADFVMYSNQWEYNDKKSHVKFIIETYAIDHGYVDKGEFQNKKKALKNDYKDSLTLDDMLTIERSHKIPELPEATRQAILKLKHQ